MVISARTFWLIAQLSMLFAAPTVRAVELPVQIKTESIRERFAIARKGDAILVPVTIGRKEHLFLLDTGCSNTIFDSSLLLPGDPKQSVVVATPSGPINADLYDPPEGSVRSLSFRGLKLVGKKDLARLREIIGQPIDGILGMDFLSGHIVHVDFDAGVLLFLKSIPKQPGKRVPLFFDQGNVPAVRADLAGAGELCFTLDTGCIGPGSGSIYTDDLHELMRTGHLRHVGSLTSSTLHGSKEKRICRGRSLMLSEFSLESPIFDEDAEANRLGLTYLSRYAVTFDFPGKTAYLREGKCFSNRDCWTYCGVRVIRKAGSVIVESVDEGSPGEKARLKAGDVVLKVGPTRVEDVSLIELRRLLVSAERTTCMVKRNEEQIETVLELPR